MILSKKVKVSVIAIAMSIGIVGCDEDKEEVKEPVKEPTKQTQEVEKPKTDDKDTTNDITIDTDLALNQDLQVINEMTQIIFGFIQESSLKISEMGANNDATGIIGYCTGVVTSPAIEEIEANLDIIHDSLKTEEGKELFNEAKGIHDSYIEVLTRMANGNIDQTSVDMTNDITNRILELPNKINSYIK